MDAAKLSMTARMSANCSSVDFALEGGGVAMAAVKMNNGGGGGGGMRSAGGGKIGSEYQGVVAWAIRAKEQGNPKPIRPGSILACFIH
jgi:hypothetical protein